MPLSARTTLRVGGVPRAEVTLTSLADCDALLPDVVTSDLSWRVLGAGSNIVAADGNLDVTAVFMRSHAIDAVTSADGTSVTVTVDAGAQWDDFVDLAVGRGWAGLETLSGIPGSVGATPIQNVGAYGTQVSDVIAEVEVWDSLTMQRSWLSAHDCRFGYRTSAFKTVSSARVITRVRFQLRQANLGEPIAYQQLADFLAVPLGAQVPLTEVRSAVLALRRSKGMVLDPADHDTWSVGSYFTNPTVSPTEATSLPQDCPQWAQVDGRVKISAAWLIEATGFRRGFQLAGSGIAISSKHSLAITNRGDGTGDQVRQLERTIIAGVQEAFSLQLEREPMLLGFDS